MVNEIRRTLALTLFIASIPGISLARPTSELGIKQMFNEADVVVKAEVVGTKELGKAKFSDKDLKDGHFKNHVAVLKPEENLATARVLRVIKGVVGSGELEIHFYSSKTESLLRLDPKEIVLLFLKNRDGLLFPIDIDSGKIAATRQESHPVVPLADEKARIIDELRLMTTDANVRVVESGLDGLSQFPDVDSRDIFLKASNDKRRSVRARAISARVKLGDAAAESEMLSLLKSPEMNAKGKSTPEDRQMKMDFIGSINQMGKRGDSAETNALLQLVDNPDRGVRLSTLDALRRSKHPSSVPTLIRLLDDKDQYVQYLAVITLCEMNTPGGRGCPSTMLFDKSPEKYKTEWKTWWEGRKNEKR